MPLRAWKCISAVVALATVAACSKPLADAPVNPERDARAPSEAAVSSDDDGGRPVTSAATLDAGDDAGVAMLPLPDEPWYRDRPEAYEDCAEPLAKAPARHFPPPFELCDPRSEIVNPQGASAHFHYRKFSVEHTKARRAARGGGCCYLIFEFPRHGP